MPFQIGFYPAEKSGMPIMSILGGTASDISKYFSSKYSITPTVVENAKSNKLFSTELFLPKTLTLKKKIKIKISESNA
jgi:hypothetical protein